MRFLLTRAFFLILILIGAGSCGNNKGSGIDNGFSLSGKISPAAVAAGRSLAQSRCQSCHAFPEPELLDKESWEHYVLPTMGYRMGLYHRNPVQGIGIRNRLIETGLAGELVQQANIFPESPTISVTDFQKITDYYLTVAPAKASSPAAKLNIAPNISLFVPHFPDLPFRPASVTLVKVDPVRQQLWVGLAKQNRLLQLNSRGQLQKTLPLYAVASDYLMQPEGNYALNIGSFFPSDAPAGVLTFYLPGQQQPKVILNRLQRPVQALFTELNGDKKLDLLVCEFGNQTGSLNWYEGGSGQTFRKHILKNAPGAVRAYVQDLNHDKRPDIIALMAQGNEEIIIFYNEGHGTFREEKVIQFSPAMGSSSFELVDFNQDGFPDILYTAGDNADFKPVQKPYHGIRIYLNNGRNKFKETYFFPQNGSYKATAADFDGDGDLDIAAIAFFARFRDLPQESFIFLENKGDLTFRASTFAGSNRGRWLTLDQGDLDGDGDIDLVLGSFVLNTQLASDKQNKQWATEGPVVVILENKSR